MRSTIWFGTSRFALLLVLVVIACKRDPFDESVIRKDLERHSAEDVLAEVAKSRYTPPSGGRITEAQIAEFLRVEDLAKRIRSVARSKADVIATLIKAGGADAALMRDADHWARQRDTAHLRAALELGVNASEHQWIEKQIAATYPIVWHTFGTTHDVAVMQNLAANDRASAAQAEAFLAQAPTRQKMFEVGQDSDALANAELVEKHLRELGDAFPELGQLAANWINP